MNQGTQGNCGRGDAPKKKALRLREEVGVFAELAFGLSPFVLSPCPTNFRERLSLLHPRRAMRWGISAYNTGFSLSSTEHLCSLQTLAHSSPPTFLGLA